MIDIRAEEDFKRQALKRFAGDPKFLADYLAAEITTIPEWQAFCEKLSATLHLTTPAEQQRRGNEMSAALFELATVALYAAIEEAAYQIKNA